ncbi:diadenylate cyclase [Candidatus Phytoplasma prunorum]|uniref:diadenylate cyclase n=1 Tax=Candidatus Phytoplasma prunorum TaxID=47565 RepID=UPI002FF0E37C
MDFFLEVLIYFIAFIILIFFAFKILFSKYQIFKIIFLMFLCTGFVYYFKIITKHLLGPYDLDYLLELKIYDSLLIFALISIIIIKAPYLRIYFNNYLKFWSKQKNIVMGSHSTQKAILDSVIEMSSKKIGALITIEKHNTLDMFSQKAILINGIVSKELIMNIFIPNTPLHDGGTIIRGDRILCAGAYYTLSDDEHFEKTTGSRHRAALGISETTDSMTLVVSEETGRISIALEGIMLNIDDKNKIQEYLIMFMI